MKEEKDILNRDVEIPEVVFRKADAALNTTSGISTSLFRIGTWRFRKWYLEKQMRR